MSDAEFACALSHINVYRKIVVDRIPYTLVLEDDVIPQPALSDFLNGQYYQDAGFTQLDIRKRPYVQRSGTRTLFDNYRSYLHAPHLPCRGAGGYVLSYEVAQYLVMNAVPVRQVADWPDCLQNLIAQQRCRVIYPTLVRHPRRGEAGWTSLIDTGGRKSKKESRRFFGVYIPPFRKVVRSYKRSWRKIIYTRASQ